MQDNEISMHVSTFLKKSEKQIYSCTKDQVKTEDDKQYLYVQELYLEYIKSLLNFILNCQLFTVTLGNLYNNVRTMRVADLFNILSRIENLIERILNVAT
jgi:hypothetical protein